MKFRAVWVHLEPDWCAFPCTDIPEVDVPLLEKCVAISYSTIAHVTTREPDEDHGSVIAFKVVLDRGTEWVRFRRYNLYHGPTHL